eukprot:11101829-Prorocentrum_lima.AAC.1
MSGSSKDPDMSAIGSSSAAGSGFEKSMKSSVDSAASLSKLASHDASKAKSSSPEGRASGLPAALLVFLATER